VGNRQLLLSLVDFSEVHYFTASPSMEDEDIDRT